MLKTAGLVGIGVLGLASGNLLILFGCYWYYRNIYSKPNNSTSAKIVKS